MEPIHWLMIWTPLKNMRQLGWWHSKYWKTCSKPPANLHPMVSLQETLGALRHAALVLLVLLVMGPQPQASVQGAEVVLFALVFGFPGCKGFTFGGNQEKSGTDVHNLWNLVWNLFWLYSNVLILQFSGIFFGRATDDFCRGNLTEVWNHVNMFLPYLWLMKRKWVSYIIHTCTHLFPEGSPDKASSSQ